ncbi:hypothetical protein OIE75_29300 [Streptomyces sp. NBC_01723]|uniref:hypothetical protein n=1 Tax=Streptomyces sp. NBC_01723 TaxID=2975921 RepID=UPI002E373BE7|nr:hypothetical protein [Streptomyces sp. NBC_01723]
MTARTFDLPAESDPVLSAMATVEKALHQYFEGSPTPRLSAALIMSQAFGSQREATAAAYRDAADLAARYAAGTVEQSVLRDLATEYRRKAQEAS